MPTDRPAPCTARSCCRYGNACISGGHKFGTRLQLVKQSVHDQTALTPMNHSLVVEDRADGTYHIVISAQMVSFPMFPFDSDCF